MQNEVKNIVKWLQEQVDVAGVSGLLVGVSGGLDSAVVAYLIKRAFPDHSLGVIMPLKSSPESIVHAERVINESEINGMTVDLSETHEMLLSTINQQLDDYNEKNSQLKDANLRARLRMSTLYTIAANYNYLVVGTDNASEWYTGYFTKYGDGGVDIHPIIDFTKAEVKDLAKYLGVPDEIIQKKPSADLWEGQTDEQEMGIAYDQIDAYIKGETIPKENQVIIERMHSRSEHKRNPLPQYKRSK